MEQKLGTVTSFRYLGPVVSDNGSKQMFTQGLHKPLQLLQKWKPIRSDNNISLGSNTNLLCTPFPYFCMPVNRGTRHQI